MLPSLTVALVGALASLVGVQAVPQHSSSSSTSRRSVSNSSVACNNSPQLCNRPYNQITFMGAHDSSFVRDAANNNNIAGDQLLNATVALDAGLRFLQTQVHAFNNTLELCHTSCALLDAGPLETWLTSVKQWMDGNPNEVVTLLVVNSDDNSTAAIGQAFENSGISKYGFVPASTSATEDWPTLQTMISQGTRLVAFIASITPDPTFPYLLNEFDFVFETTFGVTSIDGFNCTLQRPTSIDSASSAVSSGLMGLINHFLDEDIGDGILVPNTDTIHTVNSDGTVSTGALGANMQECKTDWGVQPNFVLVDFWNDGQTLAAADSMNNLTQISGRISPSNASTTNDSMASRESKNLARAALLAFFAGLMFLM